MQFKLNSKVLLASAVALASQVSVVQAAGYGINEQSTSYLGTGFAGRASNAIDASVAASNPAAISFLKGSQVAVGAGVILKGGNFEGKYSADQGGVTSTKDFQKTSLIPFGHFVMPLNDKWSFGLSGYAPFGIHLDYADDWAGRYFGDKTSVKVVNLQGTLSYKMNDDFSMGFGLIGSRASGELTQKSWLPNPVGGYLPISGNAKIKGNDTTFGWNLGALWNMSEATTLGFSYHSSLRFKLKGDFSLDSAVGKTTMPARLNITMPEKAMASVTHRLDSQWTVMADLTWTRWSRFQEFNVTAASNGKSVSYVPMKWKDTWALSLGTSYQLNNQWLLRAGYMFDQSPVTNETRTARTPDANRNWFTLGANWKASDNVSVDFAYAYVKLQKGSINEGKHKGPGIAPDPSYGFLTGHFKSSSHILGLQLNYRF